MTTTKTTLLAPTGTRHISYREDGTWKILGGTSSEPYPFFWRWKQMEPYDAPEPPFSLWVRNPTFRFWVNRYCIWSCKGWSDAPEPYIRNWLRDKGIILRWWDTLRIYPEKRYEHNGIIDVYIKSSILEKMYANSRADVE